MKLLTILFISLCLFACQFMPEKQQDPQQAQATTPQEFPEIQALMDSLQVHGATVVYDLNADAYAGYNPDRWEKGFLPASTYKIPNSLIAMETGVVSGPEEVFKWDGKKRQLEIWERDMTFKDAFHFSCVPCYQEVARKIGVERMNEYVKKFDYGKMDIHTENIDLFWLQGNSRISQKQQIDFLTKLYHETLPLSSQTIQGFKKMMVREETDSYRLSGKTGWAIREGFNVGWFVGYVEKGEETYFFATNIEPNDPENTKTFARARVDITMELFRLMGVVES